MEFVRICHELDFHNIVISMKASRAPVMLAAYRLMADTMDKEGFNYPLHLGVTEAGDGDYGRIKSTAGIATLLADGLGDTLRVSLTEAPEKEIPVCYSILQSLGLRKTMVEYVACPSCGRTLFNLEEVLHKAGNATSHLTGLDIAVMGCIVNGPGEMADADFGYVGGAPGKVDLYVGKEVVKRAIPNEEACDALIELIKAHGKWVEKEEEAAEEPEAVLAIARSCRRLRTLDLSGHGEAFGPFLAAELARRARVARVARAAHRHVLVPERVDVVVGVLRELGDRLARAVARARVRAVGALAERARVAVEALALARLAVADALVRALHVVVRRLRERLAVRRGHRRELLGRAVREDRRALEDRRERRGERRVLQGAATPAVRHR